MGNLVFQATLGGQVNLVGPNTASTYNIAVPAVSGTMVTTGDTGTVTNTMLAGSIANAKLLNSSVTIGSTAVSLGATVTAFAGITTLSISGNLTLSGGTANGVAYLNGSNVVTTGSALTFDGTNFGVGTSSPAVRLSVDSGATAEYARFNSTNASGGYLRFLNSSTTIGYMGAGAQVGGGAASDLGITAANNLVFGYGGGTEGMRLTNTGLGIGTSSFSSRLAVSAAKATVQVTSTTGTNGAYQAFTNTGGNFYTGLDSSTGGDFAATYAGVMWHGGAYPLLFGTSNVERMRLDSSGNLGLGVTPSAWTSDRKAIQQGSGASVNGSAATISFVEIGANFYSTGAPDNYIGSGVASKYRQLSGAHSWYTAGSGTAGNAITFTQAMTLDASGNLLVGTTSTSVSSGGIYNRAVSSGGSSIIIGHQSGVANGNSFSEFQYAGTLIGSITQAGTTGVLYNITSDYRLKNIAGPVTNSGAFIDKLNPVQGSWKSDGSRFIGFLAHELQEASETVVGTGVKDGKEMQSIDYSNAELIANFAAEIQSLRKRLAALEAK